MSEQEQQSTRAARAVVRTRLRWWEGALVGSVDEVRVELRVGGEAGEKGFRVIPRSLVWVDRGGDPAASGFRGLLAVGTAAGRLALALPAGVRPGEFVVGPVTKIRTPGFVPGPDPFRLLCGICREWECACPLVREEGRR